MSWRWAVVALGVAVVVSLPTAIGALPARSSELSATELLAKVKASGSVGHSGYAESVGGLDLPLTDDFTALTSLLGDRTRIRSWWRSDEDWRVDAVQTTGEAGTYRDPSGIWSWDYEQDTIVRTSEPTVRLPRVSDVEPAALARRLLSEARASDVSRIPSRRVAGRDAAGLRLRPSDNGTTIDRVDVWVDPATGLALRVEIYGKDTPRPVLETAFLDFSAQTPPASATRFSPAEPGRIRGETNPDLAAAINVFAPVIPPTTLAGLPGRPGAHRPRLGRHVRIGTHAAGRRAAARADLPPAARPAGQDAGGDRDRRGRTDRGRAAVAAADRLAEPAQLADHRHGDRADPGHGGRAAADQPPAERPR